MFSDVGVEREVVFGSDEHVVKMTVGVDEGNRGLGVFPFSAFYPEGQFHGIRVRFGVRFSGVGVRRRLFPFGCGRTIRSVFIR